MQQWIAFHRQELQRLGPRLYNYFLQVFRSPRFSTSRPSPRDWGEALEIAACWVMRCGNRQAEVVEEGRERCPFCRHPLPHVQNSYTAGPVPVPAGRPSPDRPGHRPTQRKENGELRKKRIRRGGEGHAPQPGFVVRGLLLLGFQG